MFFTFREHLFKNNDIRVGFDKWPVEIDFISETGIESGGFF